MYQRLCSSRTQKCEYTSVFAHRELKRINVLMFLFPNSGSFRVLVVRSKRVPLWIPYIRSLAAVIRPAGRNDLGKLRAPKPMVFQCFWASGVKNLRFFNVFGPRASKTQGFSMFLGLVGQQKRQKPYVFQCLWASSVKNLRFFNVFP